MPLITLEFWINAPIERVFDLARSIDAHMVSTDGTEERAIAGRTSGLIERGESVTWVARHFGIMQQLTVKIVAFDRPHLFGDEMIRGAFSSVHHTHRFTEQNGGTLMSDEFFFRAPLGILGRIAEAVLLTRYMRNFLVKRSLCLKLLAESNDWQSFLPSSSDDSPECEQ